jgi:hypothetical protein
VAARYDADFKGIGDMLSAPWMLTEMLRRAEKVAERARATAPVDEAGPHPGRYRDSISARAFVRERAGGRRAVGRAEATAPESFIVEFGTSRQEAHRTLGAALDAAAD